MILRRSAIAALAALVAAGVVVVFLIKTGGEDAVKGHQLTVTVPQATSVGTGQAVRIAGVKVGEVAGIDPVDGGRAAKIEFEFGDRAWPLPKDSTLQLRWSGTVQAGNRYIALTKGEDRELYADGRAFAPEHFNVPVEFDSLLRTFDSDVRSDVNDLLRQAGPSVGNARQSLRSALAEAPPALEEAAHVLADVADQQAALETLIASGDRVLGAVDASQPDVRALLDGAGATFDAIADEADSLQRGLEGAPRTLTNVRDTLARADGTLDAARTLTAELAPGVTEIRRTARPLTDVLGTVRRVGPDATRTLAVARQAAPDLNPLLAKVRELSPDLESIGDQAVDNLNCIRPYTPEIFSFFSNWGDYFSFGDGKDKLIRATVQNYGPAFSNVSQYNPGQAAQVFGGLRYGFPRPPGDQAGQPWFLEECGAGRDALDPTKDPEARWSGPMPPPVRSLARVTP